MVKAASSKPLVIVNRTVNLTYLESNSFGLENMQDFKQQDLESLPHQQAEG